MNLTNDHAKNTEMPNEMNTTDIYAVVSIFPQPWNNIVKRTNRTPEEMEYVDILRIVIKNPSFMFISPCVKKYV